MWYKSTSQENHDKIFQKNHDKIFQQPQLQNYDMIKRYRQSFPRIPTVTHDYILQQLSFSWVIMCKSLSEDENDLKEF